MQAEEPQVQKQPEEEQVQKSIEEAQVQKQPKTTVDVPEEEVEK